MSRPQIKRFRLFAHPGYHVRVVVWDTCRDLEYYYGHVNAAPGKNTGAFFTQNGWNDATRVFDKRRVGTIHFARERWTLEHVVHECQHAAFTLYAASYGSFQVSQIATDQDEPICYSVGKLADEVYKWLWEIAPDPKWSKDE